MFFYGTPHNGSLLGDGLQSDIEEIDALMDDIKTLKASSARRNQEFDRLKSECSWYTYGLCETRETQVDCLGKRIHVVPEASARSSMDNFYSVDADHHDVCKPDKKQASSFTCLRNFLNQIQEVGVCKVGAMVDPGISSGYVDLGSRVNEVCSMLSGQETHTVFITGLSGIGIGIGPTIFHRIGHNFQVTRFVSFDSMEQATSNLREQILRKIVEGMDPWNTISSHNISSLLYYLQGRKVLLVVDNVESQDQLDVLYSLNIWGKRTANKLIVTTTHAQLGTQSNTFEVRYLSPEESQQLFRHYAFQGGDGPQNNLKDISRVIHECENFPLSLKILGAYVSNLLLNLNLKAKG